MVEPYANPFRTYPLADDYSKFKELFDKLGVACYIFNTGHFMDKKVTVKATLGSLEAIIEGSAQFKSIGLEGLSLLPVEGYEMDFSDAAYKAQFIARIKDRINFFEGNKTTRGGFDALPEEATESMLKVVEQAETL